MPLFCAVLDAGLGSLLVRVVFIMFRQALYYVISSVACKYNDPWCHWHLRKLKQHHALALPSPQQSHEKFRSGFTHCANEVSRFVSGCPGVDIHVSARLLSHLGGCISQLDKMGAPVGPTVTAHTTTTVPPAPMTPPTPAALKNAVTVPISITVPRAVYNTPPASPEAPSQVSPQPTSVSPAPPTATTKPVVVLDHHKQVPTPVEGPVWRPW